MVELLGSAQGTFNPCSFHHVEKGIRVFVHGDDFAPVGKRSHLAWFALELGKHMVVKDKGTLGPDQQSRNNHDLTVGMCPDLREIRLLNRSICWICAGVDAGGERLEGRGFAARAADGDLNRSGRREQIGDHPRREGTGFADRWR